jgi:hypothetical protein
MDLLMTWLYGILLAVPPAGPGVASLFEMPADQREVVDTFVTPDGEHAAWVVDRPGGQTLFVDGDEFLTWERIDQVALTPDGGSVFWGQRAGRQHIFYRDQVGDPYDEIYLPDIEVLGSMASPEPAEWGFLGGSRVAFAARNRQGEWTTLLRFPAAAQNQEQRPLPQTRALCDSHDAERRVHRPLHYRLLRGKVPVFIGRKGEEECLVVGHEEAACGIQITMLAYAPATGRLAFAVNTRKGLMVHTGLQTFGPTTNVDWVTFSPDGRRLAFVLRSDAGQTIVVDDKPLAVHPAVGALFWTPEGRLLSLHHDDAGSHLRLDGEELLTARRIERVFLGPDGRIFVAGTGEEGLFLHPFGRPGKLTSLWGEGFLPAGRFFGLARLPGGKVALLEEETLSPAFNGINRVTPSPDGARLAAVGASVEGDTVLLDGKDWGGMEGRVERLLWCDRTELVVWERQKDRECLVQADGTRHCCARLVLAGCDASGKPLRVCLGEGKYTAMLADQAVAEPFQDVPLHLVYQDARTGEVDFAGRRGDAWSVVLDGREAPAQGRPVHLLPTDDGAWFLVHGDQGRRWVRRGGATAWFDSVSPPFKLHGQFLWVARADGKESWYLGDRELASSDALVSAPIPFERGFFYWAREGERLVLKRASLPAGEE